MNELVKGAGGAASAPADPRPLAVFLGVAVGYALLATSAYELFGALSVGVTFFPPAGLTFGALLLLPRRLWPAVGAAVVVGEVFVDMTQGQGFWWSLGWAGANLAEPLVGASVTLALAEGLRLDRRFALSFLAGGIVVGPVVGAAVGSTVLTVSDDMHWFEGFPDVWVGDGLGVLVVAPVILVLARPDAFVLNRTRRRDLVWVAALTALLCTLLVATDDVPLGYAAVPLLALPAARYSSRELAAAGVVVAGVLTFATARGRGPWASTNDVGIHAELVQQQAFLLVALGSAWLLKLEVVERLNALHAAQATEVELQAAKGVALALQHAIMPTAIRPVPGLRITGHYRPAAESMEVGGDWYDVILDEPRAAATILVGDVVGHSLPAAAAMGKLAPSARALAYAGHEPASLLATLDVIAANTTDAMLTTLVCARLDLTRRTLRYSAAGHPPPLLRRSNGETEWLQDGRAMPLGLPRDGGRPEATLALPPGSAVLFFTDGLVEKRGASLDARFAVLERAFGATHPWHDDVCAGVVAAMLPHDDHEDDVAVVCLVLDR